MDRYLDFTLDANFATLPDVVKDLHAHNQRYVLIVVHGSLYLLSFVPCVWIGAFLWQLCFNMQDPAISSTQPKGSYWPYEEGLRRDVFIKDAEGNVLVGQVRLHDGKTDLHRLLNVWRCFTNKIKTKMTVLHSVTLIWVWVVCLGSGENKKQLWGEIFKPN